MPVAKTYENCDLKSEPFKENGRWYVIIITKKGDDKKVRWYTEAEYARMYPTAKGGLVSKDIMMTFNARHAFGFDEPGFIYIFRANANQVQNWAQAEWPPKAWRNETFGFYTPSRLNIEPPQELNPIKLTWDEVKQDDIHMKSHEEVKRYVDVLIGPAASETCEWEINDWIEKEVKIGTKETNESRYGAKHRYGMFDNEGHQFIWETGARDYKVDMVVTLKMKVKEVKDNATVVWYCKET